MKTFNLKYNPKKIISYNKKGKETDEAGYLAEIIVKKKLWRFGYAAKHLTKSSEFDLLVKDEIRVEVKTGKPRLKKDGTFSWNIMNPYRNKYDVLAVVLPFPEDRKPLILFFTKEKINNLVNEKKIGEYGLTFSSTGHKKWLMGMGEKMPYKVFGEPF